MAVLGLPTVNVHASYVAAVKEYQAEGGYPDFDDLDIRSPDAFEQYVYRLRENPLREDLRATMPPMTLLWWTEGSGYLGRLSLWHELTGVIAESGHIGFDIRPSARRQGHAQAMLRAVLPFAYRLGINPVVLSCAATNHGSVKTIRVNGGQLVDDWNGQLYFHIDTSQQSLSN